VVNAVSGMAAGLAARGDEARVRQILTNLLANAIEFTDPRPTPGAEAREVGRVTVSAGTAAQAPLDARLTGPGPWVYVRVEDTGVGIAAERLESIFEAFVQADMTLTRTHGGTGLGLAICRRLARLMGGDVTVRSEVGVGSAFFLWLPAAPVASLRAGGGDGPGAGGDAGRGAAQLGGDRAAPGPLRALADAVLGDMERVLHAYVARVRADSATPSAHATSEAQVEDHLATFLADLAATLHQLDGAAGEPTEAVRDGTTIQRVVAERHGRQRARLGWSAQEVRREFTILREELAAAVRRRAPQVLPGPTATARADAAERALAVLDQFLAVAEQLSLESYRRAARELAPAGGAA
jgi:hypothetical protein